MIVHGVRKAIVRDLDEIKTLADQHRNELGFVLRPALEKSIERDEVFVATQENELIGFVEYHHRRDRQTTLYHIAVSPSSRFRRVGQNLFSALAAEAKHMGQTFIQLKCPEMLPANEFYARVGCERLQTENGRSRRLVVWRKLLDNG